MDARASEIEKPRELFEKLINDYPTCGKVWKAYIEFEVGFNIWLVYNGRFKYVLSFYI